MELFLLFSFFMGALITIACKQAQRSGSRPSSRGPEWSRYLTVPRPMREVQISLREYLLARGFRRCGKQGKLFLYRRGNRGIRRLPCQRDVPWRDVPIVLAVGYEKQKGVIHVGMRISGWRATRFDESVEPFFNECAEEEFDGALEFLNRDIKPPKEAPPPPPPRDTTHDDDLKLLGLTRGFSPDQLQAAYRAACRKFHPDRLVGVPEDVVKLAQEHFVKVQAAYERMR